MPRVSPFSEAEVEKARQSLYALTCLNENWNGDDYARPDYQAVFYAKVWLEKLYQDVAGINRFYAPNVTASATGEIVLEWWNKEKKLTIFVSPDGSIEYLKSWGMDIEKDMEEGNADTSPKRIDLWDWVF